MTRRDAADLRRSVSKAAPRLSVLVFTEGEKTEPSYLKHWHREVRSTVALEIPDQHGTPMTLVRHAREAKKLADKDERRGRGAAYDQVWCVFDRDAHPQVSQALGEARDVGINIALSNPCFELWLMLHFMDQTAYIDRATATRIAQDHLNCEKVIPRDVWDQLRPDFQQAADRAKQLSTNHELNGSPSHENPSSGVWTLIERMIA